MHQQFVYYLLVHLYMFFEFMKIVLDMQPFLYVFQLNKQQLLLRDSSLKEESLFDSENFFVPLFEVILQQSGIILFKGRLRLFHRFELVTMCYNAFVNNFKLTLNYIDLNERCDQIPKKSGGFTAISCLET